MKNDPKSAPTSRKVKNKGDKKRVNYVSTPKCAGYIQTESTLEATTAFTLSLDPRVVSFQPQPCTFDLLTGRSYATKEDLFSQHSGRGYKPKPYTPDFQVLTRDGRTSYVETKAQRWVKEPLHYEFLPSFFKSLGFSWTLVTNETLTTILTSNVRTLKALFGREPSQSTLTTIAALPKNALPISQLVSRHGLEDAEILSAILYGNLATDLSESRFGPTTLVSVCSPDSRHLEVISL